MTESRRIGRSIFGILGALGEPWFPPNFTYSALKNAESCLYYPKQ